MFRHFVFCLLLFPACRDQYAPEYPHGDASQVVGLWYQWPDESWVWHFDGEGLLTQSIFDFGVEVWSDKKAYWTHGDTLKIKEIPNGQIEIYLVEFQNENEFTARRDLPLALNHKFLRY